MTLPPLAELLRGRRSLLAWTAVLAAVQTATLLPISYLVKQVFDEQLPRHHQGAIAVSAALMLVLYLASSLAALVNRYLVMRTVKVVVTDLRQQLWRRLYLLSAAQTDRRDSGDVHAVVVQDTERLDVAATTSLYIIVPSAAVSVGLAAAAVVLDPLLALVIIAVVPALLLLTIWLGRLAARSARRWQADFDAFGRDVSDGLRRLTLTRLLGTWRRELAGNDERTVAVRESGTALAYRVGSWNILQGFVAAGAGLAVLVVGGHEVSTGRLSVGSLLAFYAVSLLLLRNLSALLGALPQLAVAGPCLERIKALLAETADVPYNGTRSIEFRGELEARGVCFGYGDADLLHDVDLHFRPGERVAIIGPNGAGKSTLARLLLALYRPRSGLLLADGIAYDEVDPAGLYARTGVVMQEQVLHRGTVADVIRAGRDSSDADLRRAAAQAAALEFVERLPEGFATVVGEGGKLLSGGQRQRLALARALLTQPALLLLDEPTTYLDDAAVAHLLGTLDTLPQRPTVVMVTHDPALAARADQVVQLRDGRVVNRTAEVPS